MPVRRGAEGEEQSVKNLSIKDVFSPY